MIAEPGKQIERGFTLIELLVYITIAGLILGALTSLAVGVLRAQDLQKSQALISNEINATTLVFDRIFKDIAMVSDPSGNVVRDRLEVQNSSNEVIELYAQNGSLIIEVDNQLLRQTIDELEVSDLSINISNDLLSINFNVLPRDNRLGEIGRGYEYQLLLRNYDE